MVVRSTKKTARFPTVKLVVVVCGIAGCTGGPEIQTADQDAASIQTVAAVESEPTVELASNVKSDKSTLRERWRSAFKQPTWIKKLVKKQEATPADPFLAAHAEKLERNATPLIDYTPVAIWPVSHRGGDPSDVIRLDRLTPAWFSDGTRGDATPVEVSDASNVNPFLEEESELNLEQSPVRQAGASAKGTTEVRNRSGAEKANSQSRRGASAGESERTVSINSYLRQDHSVSSGIVHGDMIVDSHLVRSRLDHPVRPISAEVEQKHPLEQETSLPRKPFGEPTWNEPQPQPTASANQPVSVAPEIPRPAERVSFSSDRRRGEQTSVFSGKDSAGGAAGTTNPFVDVEGDAAKTVPDPAPSVDLSSTSPPREAVMAMRPVFARSAATEVAMEESKVVAPLANALDLDEAKRLAQEQAGSPATPEIDTPLAVGLGLAAVAAGVVMIHGRLAS